MVQVESGKAAMLQPVAFSGRVSEAQLEKWLIDNPALAGEPLLVLGAQLAEFAEDKTASMYSLSTRAARSCCSS
jgi:hypothetical protein